jgi:hypothetical protein
MCIGVLQGIETVDIYVIIGSVQAIVIGRPSCHDINAFCTSSLFGKSFSFPMCGWFHVLVVFWNYSSLLVSLGIFQICGSSEHASS